MFAISGVTSSLSAVTMTTGILVVVCIVFILIWMVSPDSRSGGKELPGPSGFSAIRMVLKIQKGAPRVLFNAARRFGNIFGIHAAGNTICVMTKHKFVEEAFVTNADSFSDRGGVLVAMRASIQQNGSISANGAAWDEIRDFVGETIKNQDFGRTRLATCINKAAEKMIGEVDSKGTEPFDIKPIFQTYVCDILHQVSFNVEITYSDPDVQKFIGILDDIVVTTLNPSLAVVVFPSLAKGCLYSGYRSKLHYVADYLHRRAETSRQNGDSAENPSLVVLFAEYIRRLQAAGKATTAADGDGWRTVFDFFFAGIDTVHQVLMWCTLFLAGHPDVQDKVREELSKATGPITYDDREKVPYTLATMLEVLRMRPVAPMGVPHTASKNGTVSGYNIKEGALFMPNLWAIHNDPSTWNQPDTFNPDRFFDPNGELCEGKRKLVIPFSIGPRSCPGQQVARMTIFLTLVALVQRYRIALPQGATPSYVDEDGSFTMVPDRFKIILTKV